MPLVKRSYERQCNMLNGKNFICRNLFGEYIDKNPYRQGYDIERASRGLSVDGKRMIKKFIDQNIKRENILKKKQQLLYEEVIDHKTPKNRNHFWKSGLHVMEHFGPPLIDKCHKYKAEPIPKYDLNQPPFRRPKIEGDYFDKDIHLLGASES